MMKGQLEKRILIFFFIATFAVFLTMILLSWQIIRFSIRQNEDTEVDRHISQINRHLDQYSETIQEKLQSAARSNELLSAARTNRLSTRNRILNNLELTDPTGLYYLYGPDNNLLYGEQFPIVEDYILTVLQADSYRFRNYYPFLIGNELYFLYIQSIYDDISNRDSLLGYLAYIEPVDVAKFNFPAGIQPVVFNDPEALNHANLPDRYKQSLNQLKNSIDNTIILQQRQKTVRIGIDIGGGLIVHYDAYSQPVLYIFFPFTRDVNQFAHKGLLVFFLSLTGLALMMVTLAANWFKGRVISPIKDVSDKMHEIESNPAIVNPLEKRYSGILGEMIDIFNSMNRAVNQHSNSLAVYKTITDNLDTGILWMDKSFNVILCNPIIPQIFGLKDEKDIIGQNLIALIHLDSQRLNQAKQKGLVIPNFELKTGEPPKFVKLVLTKVKKIDDPSGVKFIAGIYDITTETKEISARERIEFELLKSNRMAELGRLAEGIVHNINSPLNTIIGYSQLLKKTTQENTDIDKVLAAGSSIAFMVKKLLTKVREDSISMIRPLDINKLINLELEMCRHNIFFSQNVTLGRRLAPLERKVYAVHADISICIANIINNAVQSMKTTEQKSLMIETKENDQWTMIKISDTGLGIPREDIPFIFNPDFSTKSLKDGDGFGLGLAISKSIITKYKGNIKVESVVGKGSIFTILLPNSGALISGE